MKEELRKYRALALTLVATLVVAVLLFVQFLRMDLVRAEEAFAARVARAAADGEARATLLIEQMRMIGRIYLRSGAIDTRAIEIARSGGLGAAFTLLCAREADAVRVLHADPASAADGVTPSERCTTASPTASALTLAGNDDDLSAEVGVVRASLDDAPSLELRLREGDARELRATLSSHGLIEALALGADAPTAALCLELLVDANFRTLACRDGDGGTGESDPFAATLDGAPRHAEEIVAAGLRLRLIAVPDHRLLADAITPLPFLMFGAALAIGAAACAFAYLAVDKNLLLEAGSEELRKRLEQVERLECRNSTLDQFAAMAAHDLQAPMRFIVANAHLLQEDLAELDRPELSRTCTKLIEQGERMRALLLDLLAFCRAGQDELSVAPTDVAALVEEEIALLRAREEYADTRIRVGSLPRALPCDSLKLAQILRNLLGNAVKFSQGSSPPTVSIDASRDGRHGGWIFRVEDNGPGVRENHRERIFRPFNRLDHEIEGTGMGLAIVKTLIERHGGTIWLDPDVTEGSAFCFTMPGAMPAETPR